MVKLCNAAVAAELCSARKAAHVPPHVHHGASGIECAHNAMPPAPLVLVDRADGNSDVCAVCLETRTLCTPALCTRPHAICHPCASRLVAGAACPQCRGPVRAHTAMSIEAEFKAQRCSDVNRAVDLHAALMLAIDEQAAQVRNIATMCLSAERRRRLTHGAKSPAAAVKVSGIFAANGQALIDALDALGCRLRQDDDDDDPATVRCVRFSFNDLTGAPKHLDASWHNRPALAQWAYCGRLFTLDPPVFHINPRTFGVLLLDFCTAEWTDGCTELLFERSSGNDMRPVMRINGIEIDVAQSDAEQSD